MVISNMRAEYMYTLVFKLLRCDFEVSFALQGQHIAPMRMRMLQRKKS